MSGDRSLHIERPAFCDFESCNYRQLECLYVDIHTLVDQGRNTSPVRRFALGSSFAWHYPFQDAAGRTCNDQVGQGASSSKTLLSLAVSMWLLSKGFQSAHACLQISGSWLSGGINEGGFGMLAADPWFSANYGHCDAQWCGSRSSTGRIQVKATRVWVETARFGWEVLPVLHVWMDLHLLGKNVGHLTRTSVLLRSACCWDMHILEEGLYSCLHLLLPLYSNLQTSFNQPASTVALKSFMWLPPEPRFAFWNPFPLTHWLICWAAISNRRRVMAWLPKSSSASCSDPTRARTHRT